MGAPFLQNHGSRGLACSLYDLGTAARRLPCSAH